MTLNRHLLAPSHSLRCNLGLAQRLFGSKTCTCRLHSVSGASAGMVVPTGLFPLVSRVSSSSWLVQACSQGYCVQKNDCESRSCKAPGSQSSEATQCHSAAFYWSKQVAMAVQIQAYSKGLQRMCGHFYPTQSSSTLSTLREMQHNVMCSNDLYKENPLYI